MSYADLDAMDHDRRLGAVPDLFPVGLGTRYVAWKLGRPPMIVSEKGFHPTGAFVAPTA
jgi:hypothetical protein